MKFIQFLYFYTIAVFILQFTSCTNNAIIVKSKVDEPINIYHNGNYFGIASQEDSIVVNLGSASLSSSKLVAKAGSFYGFIDFGYNPATDDESQSKVFIDSSLNAIYKNHIYDSDEFKDYYYVDFYDENPKQKMTNIGYIRLTSNESDVNIYVDGKHLGKITDGPLSRKLLTGSHRIMAKKEYFMPITIKIKMKDKQIFPYHFELKKVQGWFETQPGQSTVVQARGTLTIVTEKSDYSVYIEGYEKIPPFELKDMPAGEYKLKIKCPDFTKYHTVTVKENELTFFDLDETFKR